ncbi:MAG: CoA pyrophosphatase [Acidimicrobiia bacterium]
MRYTIDDVRRACASLPEPVLHLITDVEQTRPAAILIPVIDVGGEAAVVATKRAADMRHHRGEWVFPGGRVDPEDGTTANAARREAEEELGIPAHRVDIVGQLDSHGPIHTGYIVDVFVGVVDGEVELRPDGREVSEVMVIALSDLLDPARNFRGPVLRDHDPTPGLDVEGRTRHVDLDDLRFYVIGPDEFLWGLQGDVVFNLLHHLTGGEHRS